MWSKGQRAAKGFCDSDGADSESRKAEERKIRDRVRLGGMGLGEVRGEEEGMRKEKGRGGGWESRDAGCEWWGAS